MTGATSVSSGLNRFAMFASVCSLAGVLTGAMVTSSGGSSYQALHQVVAGIAALATVILGVWMSTQPGRERPLGWTVLTMALVQCGLGLIENGPSAAILHALLAQVLFAVTVAVATATSPSWKTVPDLVEDHGWPSLGSLGRITPVLVLLQIALGAAFRHKAMGVLFAFVRSHGFGVGHPVRLHLRDATVPGS